MWSANSEGPEIVFLWIRKMGETRASLQHSCSNFNNRILSPNGGEVFLSLLLKCVSGGGTGWKLCLQKEKRWSRENEPVNDVW